MSYRFFFINKYVLNKPQLYCVHWKLIAMYALSQIKLTLRCLFCSRTSIFNVLRTVIPILSEGHQCLFCLIFIMNVFVCLFVTLTQYPEWH